MKFWVYLLASTTLFGIMIIESMMTYPNYFSALVGIPDSAIKACIVINFAACLAILWFKFVVLLFLGNLRANEYQSIYQRAWLFFCNSILFWVASNANYHTNPYNLGIGALAGLTLLTLHWVSRSHVRELQAFDLANMTRRTIFKIVRLSILVVILTLIDIALCQIAYEKYRKKEFSLLFTIFTIDLIEMAIVFCGELIVTCFAIYHLCNNEDEDEWEQSQLLMEIIHIASSLVGIGAHGLIMLRIGLLQGDVVSFVMRVGRLINYVISLRKILSAKSELDKFTTPATEEELARDNTCVICRDEIFARDAGHKRKAAKKLGCGHIMHAGCLGSWMSRSQNCPTCRQPVHSAASSFRSNEGSNADPRDNEGAAQQLQERLPGGAPQNPSTSAARTAATTSTTHSRDEVENFINRARARADMNRPRQPFADTQAESRPQPQSVPREDEHATYFTPLNVRMTSESTGIIADRYRLTLRNID